MTDRSNLGGSASVGVSVLTDAERLLNGERHDQYGDPGSLWTDVAARWSQQVGVEITAAQAALMMVDVKIVRECRGHKWDNGVDGAAYFAISAGLAELAEKESEPEVVEPLKPFLTTYVQNSSEAYRDANDMNATRDRYLNSDNDEGFLLKRKLSDRTAAERHAALEDLDSMYESNVERGTE